MVNCSQVGVQTKALDVDFLKVVFQGHQGSFGQKFIKKLCVLQSSTIYASTNKITVTNPSKNSERSSAENFDGCTISGLEGNSRVKFWFIWAVRSGIFLKIDLLSYENKK